MVLFLVIAQQLGSLLDLFGVLVIVIGTFLSIVIFVKDWFKQTDFQHTFHSLRKNMGRAILLGLEFLVAGDIIRSVTGTPSFTSVGVLAIIVLIRSFLSITFDMEITGKWPWQKK